MVWGYLARHARGNDEVKMTIERAAKAICKVEHVKRFGEEAWRPGELDIKVNNYWPKWEEHSRAALDAIAEPTTEMIEVGNTAAFAPRAISIGEAVWRAMHAAMMKESK